VQEAVVVQDQPGGDNQRERGIRYDICTNLIVFGLLAFGKDLAYGPLEG
jgi:hypothetical protein